MAPFLEVYMGFASWVSVLLLTFALLVVVVAIIQAAWVWATLDWYALSPQRANRVFGAIDDTFDLDTEGQAVDAVVLTLRYLQEPQFDAEAYAEDWQALQAFRREQAAWVARGKTGKPPVLTLAVGVLI